MAWICDRDVRVLVRSHDLAQEEIARLIGSSRETVNNALANVTHRGWIRVDGKSVLIREPEQSARRAR